MRQDELEAILKKQEDSTLEFKRQYVFDGQGHSQQRAEVAKDLLGLVNSIAKQNDVALLILGVDESTLPNGDKTLHDVKNNGYSQAAFINIFNSRCTPPLHKLNYEDVEVRGTTLGVITIPASAELHYCIQDLVTPTRSWPANSVLVRRGDQTSLASPADIARMTNERVTLDSQRSTKALLEGICGGFNSNNHRNTTGF